MHKQEALNLMPQLLRFGPYRIYFWSNEGQPLETTHVHISNGIPSADDYAKQKSIAC